MSDSSNKAAGGGAGPSGGMPGAPTPPAPSGPPRPETPAPSSAPPAPATTAAPPTHRRVYEPPAADDSADAPYLDDGYKPKPKDWKGSEGEWRRFCKERDKARAARAELTRLQEQAAAAEAQRNEVARQLVEAKMDAAMAGAGPDFQHASVRRFFRREYGDLVAELGAEAPAFEDWLGSEDVRSDPLYSRYFRPPPTPGEAPDPASGPTQRPGVYEVPSRTPPPNPDAGAGPGTPPATATITEAQIRAWSADRQSWAKHRATVKRALEQKYGIQIGSWTPPSGER